MPAYSVVGRSLAIPLVLTSLMASAADLQRISPGTSQFRRPAAIARLDEATGVIANRCGTLSLVDLVKWTVVAEYNLGGRLTDVAVSRGLVLVTDTKRSRLSVIRISRAGATVLSKLTVPAYPLTVQVAPDEKSCTVGSRWARTLTVVTLENEPAIVDTIHLGFGAGEQLYLSDGSHMLVADAFTGRLAVVNTVTRDVEYVHDFGAHNIRGLALSNDGQTLLISHQILNDAALPRRSDIIWGVMIDNMLRTANLDDILEGKSGAIYSGQTINVGYAGQGAGDPDSLFIDQAGRAVIALAGVNEVSIGAPFSRAFQRIGVGLRPIDLLPVSEGRFVVVNELSDSLTLIDMTKNPAGDATSKDKSIRDGSQDGVESAADVLPAKPVATSSTDNKEYKKRYAEKAGKTYNYSATDSTYGSSYQGSDIYTSHLPLGPTPELGPAERGEQLFFSARLSHASWFSCHSCHVDGHTNGGQSDTFGDDTEGAPKRVLSLLGVGETGPWGWNGKKSTLPKQIHQSAASTMRGKDLTDKAATDIAAFLKTLQPPPPFQPATTPTDKALVKDGRRLFESLNCTDCHTGTVLTSADVYDVGLVDERGLRKFNPPTLRGVGYRENLFHDKRASNLEEVFTKFEHQFDRKLSGTELKSLLRYLRSL